MEAEWFDMSQSNEENDPGKDIFALLFLSFFLINAVVLVCVSNPSAPTVNIDAASGAEGKAIDPTYLAAIEIEGPAVIVVQNNISYFLPKDFEKFRKTARFEYQTDEKGNETPMLMIEDPGTRLTAGQMLTAVKMLNDNRIGVQFGRVGSGR